MDKHCFHCGCGFHSTRSDQLFCSKRCRYKYYHGNIMVLTLKKEWFDMIISGEKTEEYREMKPYWETRFINYFGRYYDFSKKEPTLIWNSQKKDIIFRNGYGNDKPQFTAECSLVEGYGNEKWGAKKNQKYYILKIHRIFDKKNLVA